MRKTTTPRIGGRTRKLEEPRGIGAWVMVALTLVATAGALLVTVLPDAPPAQAADADADVPVLPPQETLEVWLVRHAEKADDGEDPELSPEGRARAALLADLLADEGIARIHSTEYRRTQETAAPLAARLGVEVEAYDPDRLHDFADALRAAGGTHLVVGHSNTTPELVEALGGDPVSPMEESEYDRLYRVWVGEDGALRSELRHFGTGSVPG